MHSRALHRASNILEWCSCRYVPSGRSHPTNRFQTDSASLRSTQRRECLPMVGRRRPRAHEIDTVSLMLHPCDLTLQGSIDTWVATSYYISLWDPTVYGSFDTKVATSHYTHGVPAPHCTEVLTHRWSLRTTSLGPHPARKYGHRGGDLILHN